MKRLEAHVDEQMLRNHFVAYGAIKNIRIENDRLFPDRNIAYLEFYAAETAEAAVENTADRPMVGSANLLQVEFCREIPRSKSGMLFLFCLFANERPTDRPTDWPTRLGAGANPAAEAAIAAGQAASYAHETAESSSYVYDEKAGYWYNSSTGLYYDSKTGLYYSSVSKKWYSFDQKNQKYVPVEGKSEIGKTEVGGTGAGASGETAAVANAQISQPLPLEKQGLSDKRSNKKGKFSK